MVLGTMLNDVNAPRFVPDVQLVAVDPLHGLRDGPSVGVGLYDFRRFGYVPASVNFVDAVLRHAQWGR